MAIEENKTAPAFTLENMHGEQVSLKDFKGKHLILYFYPKDDTPGCTKEACGFRDLWTQITQHSAEVVGVSPDDGASHQKFIEKHQLPFQLLCDPSKKMMTQYEAYGEKNMYGVIKMGIIRSTVWIGPNGKVIKHFKRVQKAADHPRKVLELLEKHAQAADSCAN